MTCRFDQALLAREVAVVGPRAVGSINFAAPGPDSRDRENTESNNRGEIGRKIIGALRLQSRTAAVVAMVGTESVVLAHIPGPIRPNETVESVTRTSVNAFLEVCRRTVSPAAPQGYVIVEAAIPVSRAVNPMGWAWVLPDRLSLIGRMLSDARPGAVLSQLGYEFQGVTARAWMKGQVFVDARVYPPKLYVDDREMTRVYFVPQTE